jgi:RNA polymerase sigma factor (sigma-70 family)
MVSTLTRIFGAGQIDLAENVVHEALIKALQTWPFQGVPENPTGWLVQVARNQALDVIRRDKFLQGKDQDVIEAFHVFEDQLESAVEGHLHPLLKDDQLRMMFTCAHPTLPPEARTALTLKTLCGFSVAEIARAFLSSQSAVEQRITRAKLKIRDEKIPYEVPPPAELDRRSDSVLEVLYLLFNEGYGATAGDELIRSDLCEEAVRLLSLFVGAKPSPRAHALLALMLLQASRFDARIDKEGELLLLSEQDRSLWDQRLIHAGLHHLALSAQGEHLSDYHLQASIASCHALAADYESTDWERILSDYGELHTRHPSPVVALNRAVAAGMARGPEHALRELKGLAQDLEGYYLYPATLGEFHSRLGEKQKAVKFYQRALDLAGTEPERRFLARKIAALTL